MNMRCIIKLLICLNKGKMDIMEIERKWLFDMKKVPVELSKTETYYTQSYLSINPEVRIRSKRVKNLETSEISDITYKLCIKGEGTLVRHEIEKELSKSEYEELLEVGNIDKDNVVTKTYYRIPVDEKHELTVGTVDEGKDSQFSYGEIEFESEEEARSFKSPEWFGQDVTEDKSYKMKNYWKRTRG